MLSELTEPLKPNEVLVEIFENERFVPLKGWSGEHMMMHPRFSDATGWGSFKFKSLADAEPPEGYTWENEWEIDDIHTQTDVNGWSYALSYDYLISNCKNQTSCTKANLSQTVRRRKWIRSARLIESIEERIDAVRNQSRNAGEISLTDDEVAHVSEINIKEDRERNIMHFVFENEGFMPISGWSHEYLAVHPHFSDELGQADSKVQHISESIPPDGYEWVGDWKIDKLHTSTDEDGWSYGISYENLISNELDQTSIASPDMTHFYRRRKWVRDAQLLENETDRAPLLITSLSIKRVSEINHKVEENKASAKRLEWILISGISRGSVRVFGDIGRAFMLSRKQKSIADSSSSANETWEIPAEIPTEIWADGLRRFGHLLTVPADPSVSVQSGGDGCAVELSPERAVLRTIKKILMDPNTAEGKERANFIQKFAYSQAEDPGLLRVWICDVHDYICKNRAKELMYAYLHAEALVVQSKGYAAAPAGDSAVAADADVVYGTVLNPQSGKAAAGGAVSSSSNATTSSASSSSDALKGSPQTSASGSEFQDSAIDLFSTSSDQLDFSALWDPPLKISCIAFLAVEECIFQPLLFVVLSRLPAAKEKFKEYDMIQRFERHGKNLDVPENFRSRKRWRAACDSLRGLERMPTPSLRLHAILHTAENIYKEFDEEVALRAADARDAAAAAAQVEPATGGRSALAQLPMSPSKASAITALAADEFLAIFIFVLCQSGIRTPLHSRDLLWGLCAPDLLSGEPGYYLTVYEAAVAFVQNIPS